MSSGDSLLWLGPEVWRPGDVDFATPDTILTTSADEPDQIIDVWDFDPGSTEEYLYCRALLPAHYAAGGLTARVFWTSEATSGVCRWALAFKSMTGGADNVASKAFAAPNTVDGTTDATARDTNDDDITFTDGADMDSVAVGEKFFLELSRNSSHANDTMNSNDGEFHGLYLLET